ncbi:lytic transglycosylase domain-containing protein [Acinetobacter baumannii]|uniref:lytic transglycosylase domain-containing protein n=1 Tax=Acinetobacter baumannii TaxID=470 RepID=UPI000DF3CF98|nr:lytic transglycosylase domain-containing protein [Acinetobacter baumannii]RCT89655.1 lytic transglycosylase domain-containing protein [Acinetobacter baumannii]
MKSKTLLRLFLAASISVFSAALYANPYDTLIVKYSYEQGIDPNLTRSVIYRESAFNPNARSNKNAQGLMQVIPSTARLMGVNPSTLYDPEMNIIAGTRYLAFLSKRFNGDLTKIIAGYNAGHGAVEKFGGIPPYRETQNYVRAVSDKYIALSNGGYLPSRSYNYANYTYQAKPVSYNYKKADSRMVIQQVMNSDTTIYNRNAVIAAQLAAQKAQAQQAQAQAQQAQQAQKQNEGNNYANF